MATLNRREKSEKVLWTGWFTGEVRAINPTKAELEELLGNSLPEDMEEIKYEGKTKDGDEMVTLSFWMQAQTAEKQWFNSKFRLVDKSAKNKDGSKSQYVNQTGGSSWADSEKNLLEWFTHFQKETEKGSKVYTNIADKEVREAIQGEAGFYSFLVAWYKHVSWYYPTRSDEKPTNILVDIKKIFRNVDKYINEEYRPLLKLKGEEAIVGPVCALATVYTGEKDGQPVHYQNIWQDSYKGDYIMTKISAAINTGNWTADKTVKKLYEQLHGEYGCKEAFTDTILQKFDPQNHIQATNETMRVDNTSTVEDTDY